MKDKTERYSLPKVQDIMTRKLIAFGPEFTTIDALKTFNKERIAAAPVVKDEQSNEILGFVTDTDCMNAIANNSFFDDFRVTQLTSVMNTDIKTVKEESNLYEAEAFFKQNHLRHCPVVNKEGHLVGMLSRRDILIALEKIVDTMGLHKEKVKTPLSLTDMDKRRFSLMNK